MTPDEIITMMLRERIALVKMLRRLTHPAVHDTDVEDALELLKRYE
jgi:hypothetical protein